MSVPIGYLSVVDGGVVMSQYLLVLLVMIFVQVIIMAVAIAVLEKILRRFL